MKLTRDDIKNLNNFINLYVYLDYGDRIGLSVLNNVSGVLVQVENQYNDPDELIGIIQLDDDSFNTIYHSKFKDCLNLQERTVRENMKNIFIGTQIINF